MASRRTRGITIKVTDEEYESLARLASGKRVTAWVHEVVLATTTPRPVDHVVLAEVIALRTIVLNLLFAVAAGEVPTTEAMKRLIQRADDEKLRKALERLTSTVRNPR